MANVPEIALITLAISLYYVWREYFGFRWDGLDCTVSAGYRECCEEKWSQDNHRFGGFKVLR